jgi:hypothetical protein
MTMSAVPVVCFLVPILMLSVGLRIGMTRVQCRL